MKKKPSDYHIEQLTILLSLYSLCIYVITVGADRPVNSCILESLRATSTCKKMDPESAWVNQRANMMI